VQNDKWFHITEKGKEHIQTALNGQATFRKTFVQFVTATTNIFILTLTATEFTSDSFIYCGDFKDGLLV
jgi:hypothetical protein